MLAHLLWTSSLLSSVWAQRLPGDHMTSCGVSTPISCTNTTTVSNLCCFEYPGGLLMQTQFWDTSPATGPEDSWTIHGLWPDKCNGSYDSNCDPSRAYKDIASILTNAGETDLLEYMNQYWLDISGDNSDLWVHEWAKHGTCLSTLRPSCLGRTESYGEDAVSYFRRVVSLFQNLPTYDWLSAAGITPSPHKTYTYEQLASAIQDAWGFLPALDCRSHRLNGVSYYHHLRGSVIDGQFVPIDAPSRGSCPSKGIIYSPKKTRHVLVDQSAGQH
ncbi:hypothetical protein BOTBODRAFT_37976 [Botryobasidium botryosum FD-172 SS1]|uniref:ribonuclease T2 n=1 Tax=Botryobasidium botryosum (strain FD-172 SS1) TaxID=930990 RepID=A0A067LYD5_BOTB1|nr:hypothetical protein BOTBODRAFT_37976 [Botryobasidium botryosum FD-172 SS1]